MTDKDEKVLSLFEYLNLTICLMKMEKQIDAKNYDEDEKNWRVNLIFQFSMSKLTNITIFMNIWDKNFDQCFKIFLTNRGKK